jgi:exodeoxyribonuclease-1
MFPVERGCLAVVFPLAGHPTNKNEILVWDCAHDPAELFTLDADTVRQRMFTRSADLPEGMSRLPIKSIHINKSPMLVANLKTLSPAMAERWGIDVQLGRANALAAAAGPDLSKLWTEVYRRPALAPLDVDEDLYGGFVGNNDRRTLDTLRALTPEKLAAARPAFDDERLDDLLFRYRARNFPHTLGEAEQFSWEQHRAARLFDGAGAARTIEQLFAEIDLLSEDADERAENILGALYDYAESIAPTRR